MGGVTRRQLIQAAVIAIGVVGSTSGIACSRGSSSENVRDASSSFAETADVRPVESNALVASFVVMSDTHIDEDLTRNIDHLENALADIRSFDPAPDTIVLLGDITDGGKAEQYALVKSICESSGYRYPDDLTIVMGNHEQYNADFDSEKAGTDEQYVRFLEQAGVSTVYYDRYLKDLHFICLGPDENLTGHWVHFNFSQAQIDWLRQLLDDDAVQNKTSFVFCHEPLFDTVAYPGPGSWSESNSLEDDDELFDVLAGRRNVIFFTGHIHLYPDIAHPDSEGPLFVNDGAVGPGQVAPGVMGNYPDDFIGSYGWLVSVFEDRIEFKARDFNKREWIEGLDYTQLL